MVLLLLMFRGSLQEATRRFKTRGVLHTPKLSSVPPPDSSTAIITPGAKWLSSWRIPTPDYSLLEEMSLTGSNFTSSSEGGEAATAFLVSNLWEGANSDRVELFHHPFVLEMLTQTLPLSSAATYINEQAQFFNDVLSPSQNDPESHLTAKVSNYVWDVRNAFSKLEIEGKNVVDGFSNVASSGQISPASQKMKQLIDAKAEYENSSDALFSWSAILRLRDFLGRTMKKRLPESDSGTNPCRIWLSTFAKSQFQACMALLEEELMRILPATMSEVETERVKGIFNAVLQFELDLLDPAYARNLPNVELTQQSSSPWHPSNIIFTTDFDVTCTIVDSCDSLVRAAEVAASKRSAGDFRARKLLEDYGAALERHATRTQIVLRSFDNPNEESKVAKRLSGRDETSDDVVPGMDPVLKPSFDSLKEFSSATSEETVTYCDAGLRSALSKLSDLEVLCNQDVMAAGVLSGFTKDELMDEAKLVELRPNCPQVLKQLAEIGTPMHVVSANWSRDLIKGGLPDAPEGNLFVHCNDIVYDATGVSTGIIDNTVVDAFDKEQILRALRTLYSHDEGKNGDLQDCTEAQPDRKARKMMVYMGDSHTDLLGLLEADLGIVIGASSANRKVMSLYGIQLLPVVEASAYISLARMNGSQRSWRRSGILFEAQGWEEVEACLFGVASLPSTTDPLKTSEDISENASLQQQSPSDISQERLPPANLELVQVAA